MYWDLSERKGPNLNNLCVIFLYRSGVGESKESKYENESYSQSFLVHSLHSFLSKFLIHHKVKFIFGYKSKVSRSFPLPSAFLSTDIERGKVFGLNLPPMESIQPETACCSDLSTFKGRCTTFADEQGKGANDGIGKLIHCRLMIDQIQISPCNNEKCTASLRRN